ncbi:MAG: hypothetical protein ABJD97_07520 [Betaproteobacteria bacterium]
MNLDQASQDIRALFDWSNAAVGAGTQPHDPSSAGIGNDDLERALKLLACNSRDREQFTGGRDAA